MSKTRENRLWSWLSKARSTYRHELQMDRVENSLRRGMADVNGCRLGIDFWIELKTAARPINPKTPVTTKWQSYQTPWLRARYRAGGRVFVLVQVGQSHEARRYLLSGDLAIYIKEGRPESWLADKSLIAGNCTAAEIIETVSIK